MSAKHSPLLDRVLRTLKDRSDIARARGVRFVGVVGSVARGETGTTSDVDVVYDVIGEPSLFDLADVAMLLEDDLGRPVDLVDRAGMAPERWRWMSRDLALA